MKVIGINGSSRKDGNTAILISTVFEELHENGIGTELIQLPEVNIDPCKMCEVRDCEKQKSIDRCNGSFTGIRRYDRQHRLAL